MKKVSVIISTYNEESNIRECLASVLNADYPDKEIIVTDDGSTDGTLRILEGYSHKIKILRNKHRGKTYALNEGWKKADGKIIYFTDADCQIDENAIKRIVPNFDDEKVVGVWGAIRAINKDKFFPAVSEAAKILSQRKGVNMSSVAGANMAFTKGFLKEINGFGEGKGRTGEDIEIMLKIDQIGYKQRFEPKAIVYTKRPENLIEVLKQTFRNAKNLPRVLAKVNTKKGLKTIFRNVGYYGLLSASMLPIFINRDFGVIPLTLFCFLLVKYLIKATKIYNILGDLRVLFFYPFLEILFGYVRFFAYLTEIKKLKKVI